MRHLLQWNLNLPAVNGKQKKILTAIFIQVLLSLLYVMVAWFFWLWSPEEKTEGQRKVEVFIFKSNF